MPSSRIHSTSSPILRCFRTSAPFSGSGIVHGHLPTHYLSASLLSSRASCFDLPTSPFLSTSTSTSTRSLHPASFAKPPHRSVRHARQFTSSSAKASTLKHHLPSLGSLLLGLSLGAVIIFPVTSHQLLEAEDAANRYLKTKRDPIDALSPDSLAETSAHLAQRSTSDLLRSYLTFLMCELPGLVTYGPSILSGYKSACDSVPILGGAAWMVAEWLMRQTFFSHYTGGETPQDCEPVLKALYGSNIGTVLNYSVEGSESKCLSESSQTSCQVSQQHINAIILAVETAARFGSVPGKKDAYPVGSAQMKPTTLALKVSGLVSDPYLFKRASNSLILNGVSPFKVEGDLFPEISALGKPSDPLSKSDRLALENLMTDLRSICVKAKEHDVVLMIDAEYSFFQPALDRLATFLSAEFNRPLASNAPSQPRFHTPTVFNTFQALLRSTPRRVDEFISEADKLGYSIGIKLVRGAYLVSETNHWKEEVSRCSGKVSQELPVWGSKEETDKCFDSIASKLVHRLCDVVKHTGKLASQLKNHDAPAPIEVSLMIAGHNANSVSKALRQLREEDLAQNDDSEDGRKLVLSDGLRGRIMFAQLYGMADNLTRTLANMLISPSSSPQELKSDHQVTLQPFVHKYLPFGPVSQVMPYLARRAEENQSMLQNNDGRSGMAAERKAIGKELRKRILPILS